MKPSAHDTEANIHVQRYTKTTSTNPRHMYHNDGEALVYCFSSSACGYYSLKDGTLVSNLSDNKNPMLTRNGSRIFAGHLPPQPLPRIHLAEIRSVAGTRRRNGGWDKRGSSDKRGGIQTIRKTATRIQILVLVDEGYCHCICMHLVPRVRFARVLASVSGLLAHSVRADK